jgi:hypothetical protein
VHRSAEQISSAADGHEKLGRRALRAIAASLEILYGTAAGRRFPCGDGISLRVQVARNAAKANRVESVFASGKAEGAQQHSSLRRAAWA